MEALQMFWVALSQCWTVFLTEIFFFLMSSLSLLSKNWWFFACVISSAATKKSLTEDMICGLSAHQSCEKDQQFQYLWNRAESNHYSYCIQQVSSCILKHCLACQLLSTVLCLLGLREEPVGGTMQRSQGRKGLIGATISLQIIPMSV